MGYAQLALAIGGFIVTMIFGTRFVLWYIANWSRLYGPEADPVEVLVAMWHAVQWALLGMAVFAVAWLWALATSRAIVRSARSGPAAMPPRLGEKG